MTARVTLDDFNTIAASPIGEQPLVATLSEFTAIHEPGAGALLGDAENALVPENGDVMVYGDGGAGKTTLTIDQAFHLAAGDPWCGIHVPRPVRILLIENEGPRPLYRRKLRRKEQAWGGSPLEDRILVHEHPWATTRLDTEQARDTLAMTIREYQIDLVIVGPLTRIGMTEAGTLTQVNEFMALIAKIRILTGPVAFVLVHHENKGGQVSGAWEGSGDTLLHVQAQGQGMTRLYIQKARWASAMHGQALQLAWRPGESYERTDREVVSDETIEQEILDAALKTPGGSWRQIRDHLTGRLDRAGELRSQLIKRGWLVNTGSEKRMQLWHRDDPQRMSQTQVVPDPEPLGNHFGSTPEESAKVFSGSRFPGPRGTGNPGTTSDPPDAHRTGDFRSLNGDQPAHVTKSGEADPAEPPPWP